MASSSRLTASQLAAALTRGTAPAYYVHGDAPLLKDEALARILDAVLDPALRDFNLDVFSARDLDPAGLEAACASLPMMADHRVVVVREIETWRRKSKAKQAAVEYLKKPAPETIVVFVQGDDDDPDAELAAHCTAVDCTSLVGAALDTWVASRLEASRVMLTEDAQEHLLRATGGDLGLLAAEIAKLSGLQTSGPIDRDVVGEMVGVRFGETADDWRDAILRDHTGTAVTLTPRILELSGNSGVRLVTMLGASLLVLRWARVNFMKDKTRNRTRLIGQVQQLCFSTRPVVGAYQPFARLIGEVVGQWPERRLRSGLASALAADVALKSTTISDETGIITDLLFSLAITPTRADISFQQDFSGSNA